MFINKFTAPLVVLKLTKILPITKKTMAMNNNQKYGSPVLAKNFFPSCTFLPISYSPQKKLPKNENL